ncbi:mercuric transporter MerT family protein [Candidatus Nitronereus thalassa]|uniref:Mercuric transport protein MerT n=1 Tax=Candidatus Nitronereus thalassa TaxID=3020898 RepID=A0ABU3K332_9BACT|nr:mercuric transporter MerT family protein [Candidatus Nitronereus thalassa]MDT7040781.1 mercuric transporter MerT family protein [Candidatus Nitronereus thalassa]
MKGKGIYATGGLIGAVLASTCCIAPFVFLLLGVSGAWISYLTALAPYQPFFLLISLGFLGAGFWKVYGKATATCAESATCGPSRSDKAVKVALWTATLLIVTALGVEWIGAILL